MFPLFSREVQNYNPKTRSLSSLLSRLPCLRNLFQGAKVPPWSGWRASLESYVRLVSCHGMALPTTNFSNAKLAAPCFVPDIMALPRCNDCMNRTYVPSLDGLEGNQIPTNQFCCFVILRNTVAVYAEEAVRCLSHGCTKLLAQAGTAWELLWPLSRARISRALRLATGACLTRRFCLI